jgi:hypothetical protein
MALIALLPRTAVEPRWRRAFDALTSEQQDAVAPLVLTILLRRAKDRGDLQAVRTILEVALAHHLAEAPAARQGVHFLRRSALLQRLVSAGATEAAECRRTMPAC